MVKLRLDFRAASPVGYGEIYIYIDEMYNHSE